MVSVMEYMLTMALIFRVLSGAVMVATAQGLDKTALNA
jgi:hypothetical protein